MDIATRVYNHNWKIDPIFRSMLDIDFYKILMSQFILREKKNIIVKFKLMNRTKDVPLAELISEEELRHQLNEARKVRLSKGEATWLRGNNFYGQKSIFKNDFVTWLEEFTLPDYELKKVNNDYELTFEGLWNEISLWEIPALSIVSELRSRALLRNMGKFELQVLYARAMTKLWEKIEILNKLEGLRIADFGTRRRHSFLWQEWCIQAMCEGLEKKFIGSSNCLMAKNLEIEAIGTNAHELPMIFCALAENDEKLAKAPYDVLERWQKEYHGNLRIILPDTFGSKTFFDRAPKWLIPWTGVRIDSGDPIRGAEIALDWWKRNGENTNDKLLIFSDGLDVNDIIMLYNKFSKKAKLSFGWGTLLTNDFRGLTSEIISNPISLVCKVVEANGISTVKISDEAGKSFGNKEDIKKYKKIFSYN